MSEKLQKVLARAGIGSRRQIEEWIAQGIISVNDKKVTLGDRIDVSTHPVIKINGRAIKIDFNDQKEQESLVMLYHKPIGEICSRNDEQGRPTVFDNLPKLTQGRWVIVGRLDFNTAGVLLFTNDGELANQLMHPSSEIEREYLVRVLGDVSDSVLHRLVKGVQLEDGLARCKSVVAQGGAGANQWYRMTLTEGKNREVRRLWESQNLQVSRLIRIRFANITLPRDLKAGRYEMLSDQEVNSLKALVKK